MELNINDFVYIDLHGINKLAKILDISVNNMSAVCTIQMVDDGSKTLVGAGILEKINIFSLMKTNCPQCGTSWSIVSEGVNDIKKCNVCNRDGESLCTEFRKSFLQSKKP